MSLRLFSSESVTEGHPDKICDQISDAILDEMLRQDERSRVAVETMVTTGLVHVAGEVTTEAYVDIPATIRDVVREIGYTSSAIGFDADSCGVSVSLGEQSPDIWQGVGNATDSTANELGAGDQGLMFGYASTETPQLMPMPIAIAHALTARLAEVRKTGIVGGLRPDGKAQVTIGYEGESPKVVDTVLVSTQHDPDVTQEDLISLLEEHVIGPVLASFDIDASNHRSLVNPTGIFVVGGPKGDAGLTGRKIIVDTYGGMARHGGGAFSGKDPSKVDRSGAYAMRWIAKNIVAAQLAQRCEVQVAYAIGRAEPVGLYVETFGTASVDVSRIEAAIREVFDLRPSAIIDDLNLRRPIYKQTAAYGHFGRELDDFTWEKTDRVDALRNAV